MRSVDEIFYASNFTVDEANEKGEMTAQNYNVFDFWCKNPLRRRYKYDTFDPSIGSTDEVFNSYHGLTYTKEYVASADALLADPFWKHIRMIWCNDDIPRFEYTKKLLAFYFRHPEYQPRIAIILQGDEGNIYQFVFGKYLNFAGAGKSIAVKLFMKLFEPYNVFSDKKRAFKSNFNASTIKEKLIVFMDEIEITSKEELLDLKRYCTEEIVMGEQKYEGAGNLRNFSRWFLSGNDEQIVKLTRSSRRFFVLDMNPKWTIVLRGNDNSAKEERRKYMSAIANVPLESLANSLYEVDLNGFSPDNIVETPIMKKLRNAGIPQGAQFLIWCVENNNIGFEEFWKAKDTSYEELEENQRYTLFGHPQGIQKTYVYLAFRDWASRSLGLTGKQITTENKFWEEIKKYNIYKESKRFGLTFTFFFDKELVMKALKEHVDSSLFSDISGNDS